MCLWGDSCKNIGAANVVCYESFRRAQLCTKHRTVTSTIMSGVIQETMYNYYTDTIFPTLPYLYIPISDMV